MADTEIDVGDVALDLAQGRPVHVVEVYDGDAAEWSEANNYELCENYGNARFDASDDDRVFECVYCSSVKSEPSKTYAFPESRLARVETEAADEGRQVADRVRAELLEELFTMAENLDEDWSVEPDNWFDAMTTLATHIDAADEEQTSEARELARAATFGADSDGEEDE